MESTTSTEFSNIRDALKWGEAFLTAAKIEYPSVEVNAILSILLDCTPTQLYLDFDQVLSEEIALEFRRAVERRAQHEPVAYIVGKKEFMGLDFVVDPRVLIPRPETELLVEMVVQLLKIRGFASPKILDVGTGSGCIGISLNLMVPGSSVICVDVSSAALALARCNAEFLKAPDIAFFESNLMAQLPTEKQGDFDIIVSNPPYVSSSEILTLDPDLGYEPKLALDGGSSGLDVIRALVDQARTWLKSKGLLVMEIGYNQGNVVKQIYEAAGFENVLVLKDFQGHDRLVKGEWCGSI